MISSSLSLLRAGALTTGSLASAALAGSSALAAAPLPAGRRDAYSLSALARILGTILEIQKRIYSILQIQLLLQKSLKIEIHKISTLILVISK
jgi:hypothetical protein